MYDDPAQLGFVERLRYRLGDLVVVMVVMGVIFGPVLLGGTVGYMVLHRSSPQEMSSTRAAPALPWADRLFGRH